MTPIQSQHTELVLRLVKSPESIMDGMTPTKCALLHAALGISGEIAEVCYAILNNDKENLLEEVGDYFFYQRDLLTVLHGLGNPAYDPFDFDEIAIIFGLIEGDYYSGVVSLVASAGVVVDLVKKHVIYGQILNHGKLAKAMAALTYTLHLFLEEDGMTVEQALEHNINKLNVRYPEGYTDQAAKDRADKPEEA